MAKDDISLAADVQARPVGVPDINFKVEFVLADVPRDPRRVRFNILQAASQAIQHVIDTAKKEVERVLGAGFTPDPENLPWRKMERAILEPEKLAKIAEAAGVSVGTLAEETGQMWMNDRYQVACRELPASEGRPPMYHLSVRRQDRGACRDWRDLQRIKNDICGPECEGVELYPAESRLTDEANQYHLWVLKQSGDGFPFGFSDRRVSKEDGPLDVRQRQWFPTDEPADLIPAGDYGENGMVGQRLGESLGKAADPPQDVPPVRTDSPALGVLVRQLADAVKAFPEDADVVPDFAVSGDVPDGYLEFRERQDKAAERIIDLIGAASHLCNALIDKDRAGKLNPVKPAPEDTPRQGGWAGMRQESEVVARYQRTVMFILANILTEERDIIMKGPATPGEETQPWAEARSTILEACSFSVTPRQFNDALRTVLEHITGAPIDDETHAKVADAVERRAADEAAGLRPPAAEPPLTVEAPTLNLDPDSRAHAPYTPEQRASFDGFQRACGDGFLHPFTCDGGAEGRNSEAHRLYASTHGLPDNGALIAHPDGSCLYCPVCGYTQQWMHGMMADDSWRAVHARWVEDFGTLFSRK